MDVNYNGKALISYDWEHQTAAVSLATHLRELGINVVLDVWSLSLGDDVNAFMENMVSDDSVSHVLILCTPTYKTKANERKGGVGTEARIISAEIYQQTNQERFVPVILEGSPTESIPLFMRGRIFVDLTRGYNDGIDELLRYLLGLPVHKKPPLGEVPDRFVRSETTILPTAGLARDINNALIQGHVATGLVNEYVRRFCRGLDDFGEEVSQLERDAAVNRLRDSISRSQIYKDDFTDFVQSLADNCQDEYAIDSLRTLFEYLIGRLRQRHAPDLDDLAFLAYELFLYATLAYFKNRRINDVISLCFDSYTWLDQKTPRTAGASDLCNGSEMLAADMNYGKFIRDRFNLVGASVEQLVEWDTLLWLTSCFRHKFEFCWYPYSQRELGYESLEWFSRLESDRDQGVVLGLLGFDSVGALVQAIETKRDVFNEMRPRTRFIYQIMLNLDRLRKLAD